MARPAGSVVALVTSLWLVGCAASGSAERVSERAAPAETGFIVFESATGERERISQVDLATGAVEEVSDEQGYVPSLSRDGRSLLYASPRASDEAGTADVVLHDLAAGSSRTVAQGGCPAFAGDDRILFSDPTGTLIRLDLETGRRTELAAPAGACAAPLSGERYLAWDRSDAIHLVEPGQVVERVTTLPGCNIGPVSVNRATTSAAFTVSGCPSAGLHLLELESRASSAIAEGSYYGAAWSPDDRLIATTHIDADRGRFRIHLLEPSGALVRELDIVKAANSPAWGSNG